jgi:acetyl esterase/lipase
MVAGMNSILGVTLGLALCLSATISMHAQSSPALPLWPDGTPGAHGTTTNDIPTVTPFLPAPGTATGAAMVICPGGGYAHLAPHEGRDYALWLSQHGVTCFVLRYRLATGGYHYPEITEDGLRAVRWVRAHAQEYGVDSHRVGIMGSSAGGHLASTVMTHFDAGDPAAKDLVERESSRPDLGILCYAVISMGQWTHHGSKNNLIGEQASPEMVKLMSNELQVTTNTPPCFLWTTFEDKTVPMENTLQFAEALRKNHVPFALHIYEKGGHGMGLKDKPPFAHPHPWAADCLFWLGENGFLKAR